MTTQSPMSSERESYSRRASSERVARALAHAGEPGARRLQQRPARGAGLLEGRLAGVGELGIRVVDQQLHLDVARVRPRANLDRHVHCLWLLLPLVQTKDAFDAAAELGQG